MQTGRKPTLEKFLEKGLAEQDAKTAKEYPRKFAIQVKKCEEWRATEGRNLQFMFPADHDFEASKNNPQEEEAFDDPDNGEEEEPVAPSNAQNPDSSPPTIGTPVVCVVCTGI